MRKYITSIVLTLFCSAAALAQTGTIKGTVKDAKTGEAIIGASVVIEGTTTGAAADLDGNFSIPKVPVGTHTLVVTFISYQKKTIPNLAVEAGKVVIVNTALDEESTQLSEVVVTAQRATNTEVAVISEIRAAQQVAVGISSEQIVKSQDRDAAQIARRVPGVSIVDNRFVIVRGLSQRYNSVMLNDVLAPSSEVDIRAFSFDMIPSNIIDRMLVFKSGAAELPGEFAGGVIKVYTKRAPEENFFSFNLSGSYRANTTFKDAQKYEGGKTDWLGFDDGTRKLPSSYPNPFNNSLPAEQRAALGNELPNTWNIKDITVPLDFRVGFNLGRRFNVGNVTIGNLTSLNYTNANQYADVALNFYRDFDPTTQVTPKSQSYQDALYQNNVRLGALENLSFRWNNNLIEFKNLFNQMTFNETVLRNGQNIDNNNDIRSYSERFESRSIYSGQLVGKHEFNQEKTSVNWQLGYSYTGRREPDWKRARYQRTTGATNGEGNLEDFRLALPQTPSPTDVSRFYSNLNESILTAAANLDQTIGKTGAEDKDPMKIKVGFYTEKKDRDFNARIFGYQGIGNTSQITNQPINTIFSPENVTGTIGKFSFLESFNPSNNYTGNNTLLAGYASIFWPISSKLNATIGFRGEYNNQELNSRLLDNSEANAAIKIFSPLPSLNLAYNITDKALIRAAYFRSINRPEFRELAPFPYYDFNLNATIVGNYTLTTSDIDNVDLRWEYYPSDGELISLGAFYKRFKNPIESFLLITPGGAGSLNYTYINSKSAQSYGVELEIRKSLSELSEHRLIKNLSIVANASYLSTKVDLGDTVKAPDLGGAVRDIQVGAFQDKTRPMVNQSPYLINAGFYYNDTEAGWQVNLLYNVFGKRLFAVGNEESPSIYEMPRNVLDFTVTKTINKKLEVRAGAQDLLNNAVRLVQDNDRDGKITGLDNDVRTFRRGAYFTLGFNYNF